MLIAQLTGNTCSVPSLGVSSAPSRGCPIFSLCRRLLDAGHGDRGLVVQRGDTAVLTIRSIAMAAKMTVRENDDIGPRFAKYSEPKFAHEENGNG